jgi:hypothetical protein
VKTHTLYFVAGAPGSGKSTVVGELLGRTPRFVFFDIDWLAESASGLAGRDIRFAPETWPAYGEVWFSVLHAVLANDLTPVLFTPADPSDFAGRPLPDWCTGIIWLLLDCDDGVRLERLERRGWDAARMQEALHDAVALRQLIAQRIDTGVLDPDAVAGQILAWLELDQDERRVVV